MATVKTIKDEHFNISANNGDSVYSVKVTLDNVPYKETIAITNILLQGFRDVSVVNAKTGEAALVFYTSCEMFIRGATEAETLMELEEFLQEHKW
jgi:ribulose bisphosphate carboxylase small subunit